MLLLIDNYDSFTFNLYQYLAELGADVRVLRNDKASVEEIDQLAPERIVISPARALPRRPASAFPSSATSPRRGCRSSASAWAISASARPSAVSSPAPARSSTARRPPSTTPARASSAASPRPLEAIRYHSLAVQRQGLPEELEVTAWTDREVIMGLRHKRHPIEGVQFHPESIMTGAGKDILRNFLETK